ncbi:3'(2'),5'-bisphosphate nucleotidase CysQ [Motiliproteus sp. MSK22-1]|uniref:3'(2'),5'-bisphosphate nucleotidase CysQ n=1 Tax=Motiliproteus sp. MSK22-1 TaxID=1897630 RepID=UPI00097671D1|nr:3'(2'),5'-bisphosphate nucleotidase CysQ [Motiliproteus sp. MSK22-1]OMH38958.1 3'(2'),5'-bisphosphate nucleotidase [Motiliproteus sp. MSK22-1]
MPNSNQLLPQIMDITQEAGEAILAIYNRTSGFSVNEKTDSTPVTEADIEAHNLICTRLRQLTPELPILSEESDQQSIQQRHQWQRYWLVDPLDGTKEFIKRNGEFTVNIALIESGRSTLGAVHVPATGNTYAGCLKQGALKRDAAGSTRAIHCRSLEPLKGLDILTSRSHLDPRLDNYIEKLRQIGNVTLATIGSSLKICLLAEGKADLHLRLGRTCEWDTAAAQAVLEAAGGQLVDLSLDPLRYNQKEDLYNPDFLALADPSFGWSSYFSD